MVVKNVLKLFLLFILRIKFFFGDYKEFEEVIDKEKF